MKRLNRRLFCIKRSGYGPQTKQNLEVKAAPFFLHNYSYDYYNYKRGGGVKCYNFQVVIRVLLPKQSIFWGP